MFHAGLQETAPDWVKNFAEKHGKKFLAYGWFRNKTYDHKWNGEQTYGLEMMLSQFPSAETHVVYRVPGSVLMECGFDIAGASLVQTFTIVFAV